MRILLDTHAIIWWLLGDPRLSPVAEAAIQQGDRSVFVSAASGWEIATKVGSGRMPSMAARISSFINDVLDDGFLHLPVEQHHGITGGRFESRHKDPFDRLIAAQALLEGMTLVTVDREMAQFGCEILW
ncbi:PIN domain nuclease of toxin-antitoxin system [Sphingomonas vulcanisoli]|uniref:PIN domain nuclease of toxin-antitoxin system n=1 Tax=Sphingomonas vulcanisoli TaxID=1658060 RepID=A0ABX0TV83_9SPHN|nr:type II toxin-antitoxin system VapC family toxin [Sphingomonas vulcanisoli]NIJ07511.1 PIN domain nuclease of toxin-antitoxin system [Sphingomonas vulcanisoli]